MITIISKQDFYQNGLAFSDYFEEELFEYFIQQDGFMEYNPVDQWMYSKKGERIFSVE